MEPGATTPLVEDCLAALRSTEWTTVICAVDVVLRNEGGTIKQARIARLDIALPAEQPRGSVGLEFLTDSRLVLLPSFQTGGGLKKEKPRVFCIAAKPGAGDKSHGPKASIHLLKPDKDAKKGSPRLTGSSSWKLSQLSRLDGGQPDDDGAQGGSCCVGGRLHAATAAAAMRGKECAGEHPPLKNLAVGALTRTPPSRLAAPRRRPARGLPHVRHPHGPPGAASAKTHSLIPHPY